ncbi:MAG: hypothetical protein E7270_03070 [Lachnospiraceae bacterium]|nr:hypothetical protein [Lachnospiraceae bacterium]
MKKGSKKIALIIGTIVIVILAVVLAVIFTGKPNNKDLFKDCEKILARNVASINTRTYGMMIYEKDSGLKSQFEYLEYYEGIVKRDELFHKNAYDEKYEEDINFIGRCLGEDFQVTYTIESKEELDKKRIKYIQSELKYMGEMKPEQITHYMKMIEGELENFYLTADDIDGLRSAFEKYVKEVSKVKVTRAFKLDVLFTINGNEKLEFEKEVYFAVVDGELMMLSYTPEEPEEDNEHFGFSNDINPKAFADEVERKNMDVDWTDRGVSDTSYAYIILEESGCWIQNDDSGNRLCFKLNEESGITTLEYIDASGNIIDGYKGVCEYKGQFINLYENFDSEKNEYTGEKKVITLFYCNNDRAVFRIGGEEVEFISQ